MSLAAAVVAAIGLLFAPNTVTAADMKKAADSGDPNVELNKGTGDYVDREKSKAKSNYPDAAQPGGSAGDPNVELNKATGEMKKGKMFDSKKQYPAATGASEDPNAELPPKK
ncbi:MAG TPA: hypothetical protein VLN73_05770 [Alphaproteobacteria bacterium]|nr:hypothetical protein [Alphaproteobacteria bacterium]